MACGLAGSVDFGRAICSTGACSSFRKASREVRLNAQRGLRPICRVGSRCGALEQARTLAPSDEQRQGSELAQPARSVFAPHPLACKSARSPPAVMASRLRELDKLVV
jgi:hypothetical protein